MHQVRSQKAKAHISRYIKANPNNLAYESL